jgi:hypothetical protein
MRAKAIFLSGPQFLLLFVLAWRAKVALGELLILQEQGALDTIDEMALLFHLALLVILVFAIAASIWRIPSALWGKRSMLVLSICCVGGAAVDWWVTRSMSTFPPSPYWQVSEAVLAVGIWIRSQFLSGRQGFP